jgi:hypothetical protein
VGLCIIGDSSKRVCVTLHPAIVCVAPISNSARMCNTNDRGMGLSVMPGILGNTPADFAKWFNGRVNPFKLSNYEYQCLIDAECVVIFPAMNSLMMFRGAIDDQVVTCNEKGVNICSEGIVWEVDAEGGIIAAVNHLDKARDIIKRYDSSTPIYSVYDDRYYPTWRYQTLINHATFNVLSLECEVFEPGVHAIGIVFSLEALKELIELDPKIDEDKLFNEIQRESRGSGKHLRSLDNVLEDFPSIFIE